MATEIHNPNKACCTVEPVLDDNYQGKGEYKEVGSFRRAYVVGDRSSGKVVVVAYDAFAYLPQTLQGADLINQSTGAQVIIPDFFDGNPCDPAWFAVKDDPESQAKIQAWFGSSGNFANHGPALRTLGETLKADGVTKTGVIGYCWGGKLVTISATEGSNIDAVVSVHPGRVTADDAGPLAAPIALFPSSGEPEKDCEAFMKALEGKPWASKCEYKYYGTVHHGWAGGRANLKDEENLKQYKDVYGRIGHFFNKVL